LIPADERTFDGHLAQIVAVGLIARQPDRKPPQARQVRQDLRFEAFGQLSALSWMKRPAPLV
jgi:hypothetical protein